MRALFVLILLSGFAAAQTTTPSGTLTLARALELAPNQDPDVQRAKAELSAAERAWARQQADPLALRVATLQAEQALENAEAALASARLSANSDTTSLYFSALSADTALELAEQTLRLEQARLRATQIRADAGAVTALELLQARNSVAEARRDQEGAAQGRTLAYGELGAATGVATPDMTAAGLSPSALSGPPIPTLAASLARAHNTNTGVQAATTTLTLARAQLAAVDNAFNAQTAIDAAQDEVVQAEADLGATGQSLELAVKSAHSALESAARSFQDAQATRAAYRQELSAQQARLSAGSVAPITFQEAELTGLQNDQALAEALYAFHEAALALEQTVAGGETSPDGSSTEPSPTGGAADSSVLEEVGGESDEEPSGDDPSSSGSGAASETNTETSPETADETQSSPIDTTTSGDTTGDTIPPDTTTPDETP